MTLWDKINALIKGGCKKDFGFLSGLRKELYECKGDETGIHVEDVQRVNKVYASFFKERQPRADRRRQARELVGGLPGTLMDKNKQRRIS